MHEANTSIKKFLSLSILSSSQLVIIVFFLYILWKCIYDSFYSKSISVTFSILHKTRMHSSRMCTPCCSSCWGGGEPGQFPLGCDLDQIPLNFPIGCGPGPDPPQLPPWLWAWTRSPSTSPLGCGLETPQDQAPPPLETRHSPGIRHPSPHGQNSWHTLLKILPCPKLRLRAVIKKDDEHYFPSSEIVASAEFLMHLLCLSLVHWTYFSFLTSKWPLLKLESMPTYFSVPITNLIQSAKNKTKQ